MFLLSINSPYYQLGTIIVNITPITLHNYGYDAEDISGG
jgi:hypothetical protein